MSGDEGEDDYVESHEAARRIAEAGLHFRLVDLDATATDGEIAQTDDLRVNRVTVYVREGLVTGTKIG